MDMLNTGQIHLDTAEFGEAEPVADEPAASRPNIVLPDNRRAVRKRAVLLVCRLVAPKSDDLCLINDISEFGARVETAQSLRVDDPVTFEFGNRRSFSGTVRWVRDRNVGVEFEAPAELAPVLVGNGQLAAGTRDPANAPDTRRQFPRIRRCALVRIYLQGREYQAELRDLSPGGAGVDLQDGKRMQAGDWVQCEIEGVAERTGTVRWVDGERLGLSFDRPLTLRALDDWLVVAADQCSSCSVAQCASPYLRRPPE